MNRNSIFLGVFGPLLLSISAAMGQVVTVQPLVPTTTSYSAFDRTVWTVDAGRTYENVFDPDQVSVDATFTDSAGHATIVPAFWYQPSGKGSAIANAGWIVRFAPPSAGRWSLTVSVRDQNDTRRSALHDFDVSASSNPGFLRRDAHGANYFRDDLGKPCFLLGVDLCWGSRDGYNSLFSTFQNVGGNFTRIWMGSPRPMENKRAGLGRYDEANGAYYDDVFELAERHGIRVMLTLDDYRKLAESDYFGHTDWSDSPYNQVNGGPLQHPMEFFSNDLAKKLYRQRLRYLVARYSAYTSLAFWEFWNEQDNLPKPALPTAWEAEMAAYLRAIDPVQHLITTSYSWDDKPDVWKIREMDLTQRHLYGAGDIDDFVSAVSADAAAYRVYGKPHLIGEFGLTWKEPDTKFDPHGTGTSLHNALWAGLLSGDAGIPMSWWWDNYIGPKNLWHVYNGVTRFANDTDWSKHWQPFEVPAPQLRSDSPPVFSDLRVESSGAWGKVPSQAITIKGNGQAFPAVPGFLYGPQKQDMGQQATFNINLPNPGTLIVRVEKVSDRAELHVGVDGSEAAAFGFNAAPGSPDQKSTSQTPDNPGQYQAVFDKDCKVPVRAGRHTITLRNVDGDWLKLGSLTFTNARSSLLVDLQAVSLREADGGATMVWLCDPRSTWKQDLAGAKPTMFQNVELDLPAARVGAYQAAWWDTQTGSVLRQDDLTAKSGRLVVEVPAFRRDIALRLTPQ